MVIPESPENNNASLDDIVVTLTFSTNSSFEWVDSNGNKEWDIYEDSTKNEKVVDMGVRGLYPSVGSMKREMVDWSCFLKPSLSIFVLQMIVALFL